MLRTAREEDEDFGLVHFVPAENWTDWEEHGLRPSRYFQLHVDLNRVEFDFHWLFGEEDVLAARLRRLHADYSALLERLLELWRELGAVRRRQEVEILGAEEANE